MVEANRKRPWRFAARFALGVFAVFSFLPVWTAFYFSDWEGLGVQGSFWTMLGSIPRASERMSIQTMLENFYGMELVKLTLIITLSLGVGWFMETCRNRE